jgi:acyl carrier protein
MSLAVDVADRAQLHDALARVRREGPPITGVFHGAMVLDDGVVAQLSPERMERAFAPKAWGAWHLHQLTKDDPLEHFVLFSSITVDLGNPGQANYVGACMLVDQLARYRRANGRPALSVAWGGVADAGYLTRNPDVMRHIVERTPIKAVPAAALLDRLPVLMRSSYARAAISPVNWSRVEPGFLPIATSPRLRDMASSALNQPLDARTGATAIRQALMDLPADRRAPKLRSYLAEAVAGVLGTSASKVEPDRSVLTMGLDSLMAVQLQTRVKKELGCELSSMRLLGGPSVNELTDEIGQQLIAER